MFIAAEGFAPFRHPSHATRQQKHWTVITRALEAPWYLVVYDVGCRRGHRVSQTSLVAWDETLLEMLSRIPAADLTGIGRLDRQHGPGPCWRLQWVQAVWKPAPHEARTVGPLLLKLDHGLKHGLNLLLLRGRVPEQHKAAQLAVRNRGVENAQRLLNVSDPLASGFISTDIDR